MLRRAALGLALLIGGCSKSAPSPTAAPSGPVPAGPRLGTLFVIEGGADLTDRAEADAGVHMHLRFGTPVVAELPLGAELATLHLDGGVAYVPARSLTEARPELEPLLAAARTALVSGDLARAADRALAANELDPNQLEPVELVEAVSRFVELPGGVYVARLRHEGMTTYPRPAAAPRSCTTGPVKPGVSLFVDAPILELHETAKPDSAVIGRVVENEMVSARRQTADATLIHAEVEDPGELLPEHPPILDAGAPDAGSSNDAGALDAGAVIEPAMPSDAGPAETPTPPNKSVDGWVLQPSSNLLCQDLRSDTWATSPWRELEQSGDLEGAWGAADSDYALNPQVERLPELARLAVAARRYADAAEIVATWKGLDHPESDVIIDQFVGCRGDVRTAAIVRDTEVTAMTKLPRNACLDDIEFPLCESSDRAYARRAKEISSHRAKRENQFPGNTWASITFRASLRPARKSETFWIYSLRVGVEMTCGDPMYSPMLDELLVSERPVHAPLGGAATYRLETPDFDTNLVGLVQAPDRASAFAEVRRVASASSHTKPEQFGPAPNEFSSSDDCDPPGCGD